MTKFSELILPALVGGFFAVCAAVAQALVAHYLSKSPGGTSQWRRPVNYILGLLLFLAGAALVIVGIHVYAPDPTADITSHENGTVVAEKATIKGVYRGDLGEGQQIWIAVAPQSTGDFYPQKDPTNVQPDGDWISKPADIGALRRNASIPATKLFDIVVILTDKEAGIKFDVGTLNGFFERLPEGAVEHDRITVIFP